MSQLNIESVAAAINAIGLRAIGIPNILGDRLIPESDLLTGKFQPVGGTFELSPMMCGPLAAIITKLSVRVKAGLDVKHSTLHMVFEYAYTHENGGRNGYDLRVSEPISATGIFSRA